MPVVQNQMDDQQVELNQPFSLLLPGNTFVDPNQDPLIYTFSGLPSWMAYDAASNVFKGTPTVYSSATINVTASDPWGGSTSMTFIIIAGVKPNIPPVIGTKIEDQYALRNRLFYYKIPDSAFISPEGNPLYFIIQTSTGDYIQSWL